ncbi:Ig domain-containing protein [Streptomyces sp. Act-28]
MSTTADTPPCVRVRDGTGPDRRRNGARNQPHRLRGGPRRHAPGRRRPLRRGQRRVYGRRKRLGRGQRPPLVRRRHRGRRPVHPEVRGGPTDRTAHRRGLDPPGPLGYAATGLPDGLGPDPTTGVVSGAPTAADDFATVVTVTNSASESRDLSFTRSVPASGGSFFTDPARVVVPDRATVESPLAVTGRSGDAPSDLRVTVDLVHDFIGGQVIHLVAEDGTAILVKDFVRAGCRGPARRSATNVGSPKAGRPGHA